MKSQELLERYKLWKQLKLLLESNVSFSKNIVLENFNKLLLVILLNQHDI